MDVSGYLTNKIGHFSVYVKFWKEIWLSFFRLAVDYLDIQRYYVGLHCLSKCHHVNSFNTKHKFIDHMNVKVAAFKKGKILF